MLRKSPRALVVVAALAAAAAVQIVGVGLLADDEPVACGCGCGLEVGSCCCAAPRGIDLALRCTAERGDAQAPVVLRPPAVACSEVAFPEPDGDRRPATPGSCRRWSVDLEPDPPVPEAADVG